MRWVSLRSLVLALLVLAFAVPVASAAALAVDARVPSAHAGVQADAALAGDVAPAVAGPSTQVDPGLLLLEEVFTLASRSLPPPAAPPGPTPAEPPAPIEIPLTPTSHVASSDTATTSVPPGTPSAVAAVGGLALVWVTFEKLGLLRALVALYFRVQPSELLEHERRERVITLIRERPGIGPTDIADDLGTGWGVTSYHLDRLERAGLVASQRVGHHRCYFLPGAIPRDQQKTVALFRGETTRRVAELVAKCPGIAQSQLCAQLGLSASAASKQLSRLVATGLIRRESDAGSLRLFPTASLAAAM